MCAYGIEAVQVRLCRPTPIQGRTSVPVDPCIAPLVQALNDAGVETVASCCGHGKALGSVALADGRELLIAPSLDAAEELRKIHRGRLDDP